jgi:15-cis-phytoene synthase
MTSDSAKLGYAQCDQLLKRGDPDRWFASLLLPQDRRGHVQALYAFSLEIARVRRLVSEPMLGEIRFQWWREVLAGDRQSEAEANPVAAALLDTVTRCDLPTAPLLSLIDARLFDLYDEPMPSLEALDAYAIATVGRLFELSAAVLDPSANVTAAAGEAGIAYALTGLMRALPWHAISGQVYIPKELLQRHGALIEAVRAGLDSFTLHAALKELRAHAREALARFEAAPGARKGPAAAAFLPVCLCPAYLRLMDRANYGPFETMIRLPQWSRQWRLWRAARAIRS